MLSKKITASVLFMKINLYDLELFKLEILTTLKSYTTSNRNARIGAHLEKNLHANSSQESRVLEALPTFTSTSRYNDNNDNDNCKVIIVALTVIIYDTRMIIYTKQVYEMFYWTNKTLYLKHICEPVIGNIRGLSLQVTSLL